MGMGESVRKSRIGKHHSTRRRKIAERQKILEEDEEEDVHMEGKRKGLETLEEIESEKLPPVADQVKQGVGVEQTLKFSTLLQDDAGSSNNDQATQKISRAAELVTPASPSQTSPIRTQRWSDATPPPTIRIIRHDSELLQPSPQTPPSWEWRKPNLGRGKVQVNEDVKENLENVSPLKGDYGNWNGHFGRPDSLGLYDSDGFLKSSPAGA
jgi:hypothetical protein